MNWYKPQPTKPNLETLRQRSSKILQTFSKVVEELQTTNTEVKELVEENIEVITSLQAENKVLVDLETSNNKIINNINKLLDK